jgi:hypothetical protein
MSQTAAHLMSAGPISGTGLFPGPVPEMGSILVPSQRIRTRHPRPREWAV